jgi:hypothetical protein
MQRRDWYAGWPATIVVTGLLVVPSFIDIVSAAAPTSGDIALIELRVRDVFSSHPPWTGAYSRYGWDHPGPMFSWLAAAPYRMLGGGARALGLVALAVNALAIGAALRLAASLGRAAWLAVTAAIVALVVGVPASSLASVWNVTITNVALVAFAVACWCIWSGEATGRAGWIALLSGTFIVQSHVGLGVVIAPLASATAALAIVRWRRRPDRSHGDLVRPLAVIGLLWVVPFAIDAVGRPPGNLGRIARWSIEHDEPRVGTRTAAQLLGRTSSLTFLRRPRLERGVLLDIDVVDLGLLPGLAVLLLAIGWVLARRAGWRREMTWCSVVGSLWLSGAFAIVSITRPLGWWLVQWLEPLGWMTWSAIGLVTWRVVAPILTTRQRDAMVIVVSVALVAGAGVHAIDVARSHDGTTAEHAVIHDLTDAAASVQTDGATLGITTAGVPLLADATLAGVVAGLERRGVAACVEARLRDKFRSHRVCGGDTVELLLRLERSAEDPPAGATTLAIVDPLTSPQRMEADRISAEVAQVLERDGRAGEIDVLGTPLADVVLLGDPSDELLALTDDVRRLAELRAVEGDRYGLYLLTG